MTDCLEVLFVSDGTGRIQSANCFDPHIGTSLMSYKGGGGSSKKCLSVIGKDFLLSAEESKPLLHVWLLNSQEPSHDLKMVLPGKPSAISISPDGNYCVGGIDCKIYVWLTSTGCLLNVISRHYQAINKIIFTGDSSYFITAGEDGLVLIWKLADVVAKQHGNVLKYSPNQVTPVYTFSQHSLPVTDIFVGHGNLKARLFTISVDQTCKIFCLSTGTMLLSLVFNHVLTSITVNELETDLFVGTTSGKILLLNLDPYPRSLEHHIDDEEINAVSVFRGHKKPVNFLSISLNGVTLASGSDDENVFLWDIPGKQLIRKFEMKGPITNMFFYAASSNIFSNIFQPSLVVSKFEKVSNTDGKNFEVNVWVHENLSPTSVDENMYEQEKDNEDVFDKSSTDEGEVEALKQQIYKLKEINKQLYQFAMSKILKNPLSVSVGNEPEHKVRNGLEEL